MSFGKTSALRWIAALLVCLTALVAPAAASTSDSSELPDLDALRLLRRARLTERAGDAEGALRILQEAVTRYPSEILPVVELVAAAERSGNQEIHETYRRQLQERLTEPEVPLPPSVALFLARAPGASERDHRVLLAAIEHRLPGADGKALLGYLEAAFLCEIGLGDRASARARLASLIERDPSDRFVWRAFHLDVQLERWEDALEFARSRVQDGASPTWVEAIYLRALARRGPSPELDGLLEKIATNYPEDEALPENVGHLVLELAWLFYDDGYEDRSKDLFRFLHARGESVVAARTLTHLFGDSIGYEATAADETPTEEADPHRYYDQGTSLLTSGEAAAAIELLAVAAEKLPEFEPAWYNYGLAAMHLERWTDVERVFRRVLELNPSRSEAHLNRGLALYHLDRCDEAVKALAAFLEVHPERYRAYYYQATCYRLMGDPRKASEAMDKYRQHGPQGQP
ncbi:MAG: tetratricopeptide repeat protein [Thermoanaerobaculia bacterium]